MRLPFLALLALCVHAVPAMDLVEALPLTERIIMIHVDEGHVVHHVKGQKRNEERVVATPLDVTAAGRAGSWTVTAAGDPAFAGGVKPLRIGRKSKGTDFAWLVEGWDAANNRAVNKSLDHAKEHWLYLVLPAPLQAGKEYAVASTVPGVGALTVRYAPDTARSEAVHVNLVGYRSDSPVKYAYVHHWQGDLGSLELSFLEDSRFRLIDQAGGKTVFTGTVRFRAKADQPETGHAKDTPDANYLAAEVWECDFSTFTTPGRYVVAVDGVGCSFPFAIAPDVYREAFRVVTRGLYHNRSGIALTRPFTDYERPAPHHPKLTPGFAGRLQYTRVRWQDWGSEGGDPKKLEAAVAGPLDDAWGWYQDAGDWDAYDSHLNVAACLLFAYECAPRNFTDQELNIPESGNGVPDILDEAAWLPRFCHRLRHELLRKQWGTGGVGLRVSGDAFGGDGDGIASYEDVNRTWVVSGEDPWSTFRYAAAAAHLAWCLKLAQVADPQGVDWTREAMESWAWAVKNLSAADEKKHDPREMRMYAAATLFRLTGDAQFQQSLDRDTTGWKADRQVWQQEAYGAWAHLLGALPGSVSAGKADPSLVERLRAPVLGTIRTAAVETPSKRALRWGGNFWMPMLVGQQTTPWILEGIIGATLLKDADPAFATQCRAAVVTSCDYVLGTNALNQTWVTGLGPRHPTQLFHLDAWYNGKPTVHPGLIPYGPWKKEKDLGQGPWDQAWPHPTCHPAIDRWPGNERWFDNRCAPMTSEFTVHQNNCYAAAAFGFLCAPTEVKP
jgi:endoglucanase